jgi:ribose 5-phosphate isomerase B
LKPAIVVQVELLGHRVIDCGAHDDRPSDYPDFAREVGRAIASGNADRGIRAALCHDSYSARQAVQHDAANLLCLGARVIGSALADDVVCEFLRANSSGDPRHVRRLEKITEIERESESST